MCANSRIQISQVPKEEYSGPTVAAELVLIKSIRDAE